MVRMSSGRWAMIVVAIAALLIASTLVVWNLNNNGYNGPLPRAATEHLNAMAEDAGTAEADADAADPGAQAGMTEQQREFLESTQGEAGGGAGSEAFEAKTASDQFAQARTAPSGIVAPGAYSAAFAQLTGLATAGGAWSDVTRVPYDSDDPAYRDYDSNSSGGSVDVTGPDHRAGGRRGGYVYAAGADGGVWRSSTGGGHWTPIADGLPACPPARSRSTRTGPVVRDRRGEHRRHDAMSATASIAWPTRPRHVHAGRPGRRDELESTTIRRCGSPAARCGSRPCGASTATRAHRRLTRTPGTWRSRPNPTTCPGGADGRRRRTRRTRTSSTTSRSTRRTPTT